jgi:hypothetical protein
VLAGSADASVSSLVRAGHQLIAAGRVDGAPAAWRAGPGRSWRGSAMSLHGSWDGGGAALASAAAGPAGWIAVGRTGAASGGQPVVLTSPDGTTWHPALSAQPLLAPGVTISKVAGGPAGYVVVGSEQAGGAQSPAAWYSANLMGWARAGVAWPAAAAVPGPQRMLAVTAAGTGFVAAGYAGKSPAVWTSPDGRDWHLTGLPLPAGATTAALTSVTVHGARVVATGTARGAPPARVAPAPGAPAAFAASSANGGRTWRESLLPRPRRAADLRVAAGALTAAPGGFVVAGAVATATGQNVLIWWSRDGLAWHVTAPAAALLRGQGWHAITALAAAGHTLTAAGYVVTAAGQHPILWQARFR